jgi:energy-converting hydrogenase A subunit M
MTNEDIEKIIKRNMNLQINLAGIRADFEEASQRQWVGLTDEEIKECMATTFTETIKKAEAKLKEKNNMT